MLGMDELDENDKLTVARARKLLGREGYLMHTLPVTESQLILSCFLYTSRGHPHKSARHP